MAGGHAFNQYYGNFHTENGGGFYSDNGNSSTSQYRTYGEFGKGASAIAVGAGGGWYGGGAIGYSAGGGSGYIGGVLNGQTTAGVNEGNGFAVITYIGDTLPNEE